LTELEHKYVVLRCIDAIAQRDDNSLRAFMLENVKWWIPEGSNNPIGVDGLALGASFMVQRGESVD
jgi:hypothetical protein